MRVVLDTNVLVSGLWSSFGPPATIVGLVAAGTLPLLLEERILGEYREVLARRRFGFDPPRVESLLLQVEATGEFVSAEPLLAPLPDPKDEVFLAVAISARADYLVTGSLRHFPPRARHGVAVVSPREFLEVLRGR
ncbi:MAG: putative toxin-antitoxin system toxin component, PIN family [Acidobacteriota bacterium]|nr:putative toxin-antitoxin system toxin component, PIN family [Acidobacteriota bacterium]